MKKLPDIRIPIPMSTQHANRGYNLPVEDRAIPKSFRITPAELKEVQEAAALLDISLSEFIRWVNAHAAKEVKLAIKLSEFS